MKLNAQVTSRSVGAGQSDDFDLLAQFSLAVIPCSLCKCLVLSHHSVLVAHDVDPSRFFWSALPFRGLIFAHLVSLHIESMTEKLAIGQTLKRPARGNKINIASA